MATQKPPQIPTGDSAAIVTAKRDMLDQAILAPGQRATLDAQLTQGPLVSPRSPSGLQNIPGR